MGVVYDIGTCPSETINFSPRSLMNYRHANKREIQWQTCQILLSGRQSYFVMSSVLIHSEREAFRVGGANAIMNFEFVGVVHLE